MSSTLHLVAVSNVGAVMHATRDDDPLLGSNGWFPFEDVRTKVNDNKALASAVCATTSGGDLHICALDGTGKLWHTIRFVGGNWQPYWGDVQSQEPQGPDIQPDSAVGCAVNQSGDLHVCAIGKSGKLWHTIQFAADDSWQPFWGDVQSQEPLGPDIQPDSAVACAVNQSGDLHVCAIGKSGKLWHTIRFVGGNWQPFWGDVQSQVPDVPNLPGYTAVACAVNRKGDLHLCMAAGLLLHIIRFANDGSWQPYWGLIQEQTMNTGPNPNFPFIDASCSAAPNDDLHVCGVVSDNLGPTGYIWHTFRFADGHWYWFDNVGTRLRVGGDTGGNTTTASISHA